MYVETLLLDNALMDIIILRLAGALAARRIPTWRLLVGAVTGAAFSVAAFALPLLLTWPFKLIFGLLLTLALPMESLKSYLANAVCTFIAAFMAGGLAVCLALCGGSGGIKGGIMVCPPSVRLALLTAALAALLPGAVRRVFARGVLRPRQQLVIRHAGKVFRLAALVDTGNSLLEPVSGLPVCIAYLPELAAFAKIPVPLRTVTGPGLLMAFLPERAELCEPGREKTPIPLQGFIAVSHTRLAGTRAVISPAALPTPTKGRDRDIETV